MNNICRFTNKLYNHFYVGCATNKILFIFEDKMNQQLFHIEFNLTKFQVDLLRYAIESHKKKWVVNKNNPSTNPDGSELNPGGAATKYFISSKSVRYLDEMLQEIDNKLNLETHDEYFTDNQTD
jgi:hypothetical protein